MVILKHLTLYTPDNLGPAPAGAMFLKSDGGADWYQAQIHFAGDTRKFAYDDDGLILIQSNDISKLWPIGMSVTEIKETDLPSDFPVSGIAVEGWQYIDDKISHTPTYHLITAEKRRESEMAVVSKRITALMEAQDDGDITQNEEQELADLRLRRSRLRRLDLTDPEKIVWP